MKEPGLSIPRDRNFWLLITAFFFSGLSGLVYEVVWSRMLTLVFGNTTYAIATVAGVFMLGLALGSYLSGRWLPRIGNILRAYAFLEIGIGVYAVLFAPILSGVETFHSYLFASTHTVPVVLNLIRILLCSLLLLAPTLLMGATVPLLGEALTRSPRSIGRDIGALYAFNTLGAAAGCFLSAFIIIPALGVQRTLLTGALINILIGLLVWRVQQKKRGVRAELEKKMTPDRPSAPDRTVVLTPRQYIAVLMVFAGSGFLALLYEVAWSRALILVFGTSIYAFATILTIYLLGIALGSLLLGRVMDRISRPVFLFSLLQMGIGASVLVTTPVIGRLPDYFLASFSSGGLPWNVIALREFAVCLLIIFVPTFASGASFPLVARILSGYRSFNAGRTVSKVYTFNTAGCILGSLMTGFVLIPLLGVERSLLFGGAASLLMASLLAAVAPGLGKGNKLLWATGPVLAAIAGSVLLPSWNVRLMNSGVYMYARNLARNPDGADLDSIMSGYKLLFHKEGASATVAVFQRDAVRFLRVNGKTDGGNSSDNYTQSLLGLLPVVYSKNPENALVIGLGTGITVGSVLDYPVRKLDCVEISPEVVQASHFFDEDSGSVLNSPRTRLHILDGRTWLMAMPEKYDLITSEPSHPWQTGNANLFTIDFFKLAVKRLRKGGVFCQWLPIYQMEPDHFRLLVSSFHRVFPNVHIWMVNSDALLIGSVEGLAIDYPELIRRMAMPSIAKRLAKVEIHTPEDLLSFFYLDEAGVSRLIEGVRGVNSDDRPVLEFSAPKYLLERVRPDIFFLFLDLARGIRVPLVNVSDPREVEAKRARSRKAYFRQWKIPEPIIDRMVGPE